MDEDLLSDIALVLMSETRTAGYALGSSAQDALKRIMLKVDVTLATVRTRSTQEAIALRLRELLCLPPAA